MLLRVRPSLRIFTGILFIVLVLAYFGSHRATIWGQLPSERVQNFPGPATSSAEGALQSPPVGTPQLVQRGNTIVMAATEADDTKWVSEELPEWQPAIYSVDNTSKPLHTPANKGKEAMAYLTYIIDNYEVLPNVSVFLHAHKEGYPQAWHNDNPDYSNTWAVRNLRISSVEKRGFLNLRCNWIPGCPADIQPFRNPPEAHRHLEHIFARVWKELFGTESLVPETIGTPCCAQFAATKEAIRMKSKQEWAGYRQWLLTTDENDEVSGRVFEFLWHILMGREAVMCKEYQACYCEVYGMYC